MSINNREEANKYYQLINGLVDQYVENYKIRPSRLRAYFKPNNDRFNRFLKKNGLDNVVGANQILNDVIDDRVSIEKDGVATFEMFNYFESSEFKIDSMKQCLYKGVEKSTLSQEKILADYFDTNLSSINILDSDKHHFSIEDWEGDKKEVIIYSEEEFELIKSNFIEYLFHEISKKKIEIGTFEIELENLIEKETFENKLEKKFNKNTTSDLISDCLGENWEFEGVTNDHYIWTK